MTQDAVDAVLQRALDDARFRALLTADPAAALRDYDLTDEERSRFASGTASAERLDDRISKTDLSAMLGGKTSSPNAPRRRTGG